MAKTKAKTKLPKRIAGVKVPKRLRRSGGRALDAVRHPLVADLAAAGLLAAAAAFRDNRRVRATAGKAKDQAGETAAGVREGAVSIGAAIAAKAREGAARLGESGRGSGVAEQADAKPRATRSASARKPAATRAPASSSKTSPARKTKAKDAKK